MGSTWPADVPQQLVLPRRRERATKPAHAADRPECARPRSGGKLRERQNDEGLCGRRHDRLQLMRISLDGGNQLLLQRALHVTEVPDRGLRTSAGRADRAGPRSIGSQTSGAGAQADQRHLHVLAPRPERPTRGRVSEGLDEPGRVSALSETHASETPGPPPCTHCGLSPRAAVQPADAADKRGRRRTPPAHSPPMAGGGPRVFTRRLRLTSILLGSDIERRFPLMPL